MAGYRVFVDESGGFSFRQRNSFVGGFVCVDRAVSSIISCLKSSVENFNSSLRSSQPHQSPLVIPDDLHFMPLHCMDLRSGADAKISVSPDLVPNFFRNLYSSINKDVAFNL